MTLVELLVAGGLILVLGTLMLLGVLDQRRRARDALLVSSVRQTQAGLEAFRAQTFSYPGSSSELTAADAGAAETFGYQAEPQGCGADKAEQCTSYRLSFSLEGRVGLLSEKNCTANPQGLSCSR
jgi:type II secretory pathway pseudopilin PulG